MGLLYYKLIRFLLVNCLSSSDFSWYFLLGVLLLAPFGHGSGAEIIHNKSLIQ
jgi:hypothetical protein